MPALAGAEPLRAIEDCRGVEAACVTMTVTIPEADEERVETASSPHPDRPGWTRFVVPVRGRMEAGPVERRQLAIAGYTDGIECSSFGQSTVAVLGFDRGGKAILATSLGALVIEDPWLVVGCPGCAKLVDPEGRELARFTTPAWTWRSPTGGERGIAVDAGRAVLHPGG